MHAFEKLEKWTHLYHTFKENRDNNPWYPVPLLENANDVLKEITNSEVPDNSLQVEIDMDDLCQGKNLALKIAIEGVPEKII